MLGDLPAPFGDVNRISIRASLYKLGISLRETKNIRLFYLNPTLSRKDAGIYGAIVGNNVGVFQGSALSGLVYITYLGS